jgi:hypothetical protein
VNLNHEIDAVVARLSAGEDPRSILTEFARAVRGSGNVTIERDVYKCVSCKTIDSPCFKCKAVSMVGEQGVIAAPVLLAKLGPMIANWASERKARKDEDVRSQQAMHNQAPPVPPPGQQRF